MNKNIQFFSHGCKFLVRDRIRIRKWIETVVHEEGCITGEINFILTNDENLLKFNLKYLNTNTYTDIITFSLSEEELIISGDVYISIERVNENAEKYKVGFENELRRVLIHGVLHLMGYDDTSSNEKRRMTRLENKYLSKYADC